MVIFPIKLYGDGVYNRYKLMGTKIKQFESKLEPIDIINSISELKAIVKRIDNQFKYAITNQNYRQEDNREQNQDENEESKHNFRNMSIENRNNRNIIQANPNIQPYGLNVDRKN